jgi:mRNA interferase MazF
VRRGDFVIGVASRVYGKPRPHLVVQTDAVGPEDCGSVLLCPTTGEVSGLKMWRVLVQPTSENGLREMSEIMVDKLTAVPLDRIRQVIGRADDVTMRQVERAMLLMLGFS